jgi:hypothetical protein
MTTRPAIFKWRQTEPQLILYAVRWYLRYSLSLRDVEEWRTKYNQFRPYSALGYQTFEFARMSTASFAVHSVDNTGAKPHQGNPDGLASLGLDPALHPCEKAPDMTAKESYEVN